MQKIYTYVSYTDFVEGFSGYGVHQGEDEEYVYVTTAIGVDLLKKHSEKDSTKLPVFSVPKAQSTWSYQEKNNHPTPAWVLEFSAQSYSEEEIHHIALFFEHILHEPSLSLAKRMEMAATTSLLPVSILQQVIRFTLFHIAEKDEISQILLLSSIQKIMKVT